MLLARLPAGLYGSNPAVRRERVTQKQSPNRKESIPGLPWNTDVNRYYILSHSPDAQGMDQEYLKKTKVFWRRLKWPLNHYPSS